MKRIIVISILVVVVILGLLSLRKDELPITSSKKASYQASVKIEEEDTVASIEVSEVNKNEYEDYIISLPTIDDLQNLTEEEVHQTPEMILEAGELIGRIHDEAESEPVKRVDAMNFFKMCAEDEEITPAVRAVCLNKIYKLIPEWKLPLPLDDEKISKEVTDLALKLP